MNTAPIVSRVWSFCQTLRDDGVGYGDYLEQLTYLIFLKMADEYAKPPYNRDVGIPAEHKWASLKSRKGAELEDHYVATLRAHNRRNAVTFYYFAYGSNMLTARLARRCPGARRVGRAEAGNYAIEFSKLSKDKSGKATLRHTIGGRTSGVVFEIPITERDELDRCEGVGNGYERCDAFPVRLLDNDEILKATTYLATSPDSSLKPYDWYFALVIAGAEEHQLGDDYIAELRRVEFMLDPCPDRKTRLEAIDDLKAAEIADYGRVISTI